MSKFDNNNENQMGNNYLIWLFVYFGIGFVISILIPFPISIGVMLLFLILLNVIRTKIVLRKAGMGSNKGWHKSFSSSGVGQNFNNGLTYTPLKFYCMNCGKEHRKITCPKCGSKAVRAM